MARTAKALDNDRAETLDVGEVQAPSELSSIHAKMHWVMSQVSRIPKSGWNSFHKYNYVKEDDLTDAIRKLFLQVNVFHTVSVNEVIQNGTLTTILTTHTFTDVDTGQEIKTTFAGCGDDKGDKGIYKAMTGDMKYLLLKTFMIPTGDDPESDPSTDERNNAKQGGATVRTRVASVAVEPEGLSARFLGFKEGISTKDGKPYYYMDFNVDGLANPAFKHLYVNSIAFGFNDAVKAFDITDDILPQMEWIPPSPLSCKVWLDQSQSYPKLTKLKVA